MSDLIFPGGRLYAPPLNLLGVDRTGLLSPLSIRPENICHCFIVLITSVRLIYSFFLNWQFFCMWFCFEGATVSSTVRTCLISFPLILWYWSHKNVYFKGLYQFPASCQNLSCLFREVCEAHNNSSLHIFSTDFTWALTPTLKRPTLWHHITSDVLKR